MRWLQPEGIVLHASKLTSLTFSLASYMNQLDPVEMKGLQEVLYYALVYRRFSLRIMLLSWKYYDASEIPYYFVADDVWTEFLVQEVIEIIHLLMR